MVTPESERMAVVSAGGNPILILPPQQLEYEKCMEGSPSASEIDRLTEEELSMIYEQIDLCDGIVLPGGSMMFEYDRKICEYCHKKKIPLLGICMGMQVMCTYDRDVKLEKIQSNIQHKDLNEDYIHSVDVDLNSKLYSLIHKSHFMVNSRHLYQVLDSGSMTVVSRSEDGVIEAVEDPNCKFFIGVQWHPELNYLTDDISKLIWKNFIQSCLK